MKTELLSAVILLTLVVDPFGNVPLVNAMLAGVPPARRRLVIVRECAIAAATVTMLLATLILVSGDRLQRWLGERAMQAVERLMGLILTAIAVEMLLGGVREFVEGLK